MSVSGLGFTIPSPPVSLRTNPTTSDGQKNPVWIVQKYGGTSVGKFLMNIPDQTLPTALDSGHRVAIVCSARSGDSKSTGTTHLLLRAAAQAIESNPVIGGSPSRTSFNGTPNGGPNPLRLSQILHRGTSTPYGPRCLSRTNSGFMSPKLFTNRNSSSTSLARTGAGSGMDASVQEEGAVRSYDETVEIIKSDHLKTAAHYVKNPEILSELESDILYECDRLRSLLVAAEILEDLSPKSKDLVIGVGERLSCRIVTACLIDQGFDAELVCLDSIVDKLNVEAVRSDREDLIGVGGQLSQLFYDQLAKRLGERIRQCEDRIPVITGFFGVVPGSLLTQIGRGYTDLCASLCAVGLNAVELQVWKEVDGIFTADPRKVPNARLLSVVNPEEAAELTYYGSEVIHPFTMEQVVRASIPIRIKNVMNPTGLGTVIYPVCSTNSSPSIVDFSLQQIPGGKSPTAVTIKDSIVVINVHSNRKTISHGFFARIFGTLDRYGIVVDLISTSEVHVSMAIMLSESYRLNGLERLVRELKDIGEVSVLEHMAILSLVGRKMKNMVGVAGKMFSTLAAANVNIEMISQGASEINISCVISHSDSTKALKLVHDTLIDGSSA